MLIWWTIGTIAYVIIGWLINELADRNPDTAALKDNMYVAVSAIMLWPLIIIFGILEYIGRNK